MTTQDDLVAWVRARIGLPYVWGGTGPTGYDCSGLCQKAYLVVAGIDIGRDTAAQQSTGVAVAPGDERPSDLWFFGELAGAHAHVGMYVGGGQMIDAPHTGAVVRQESVQGWSESGEPSRGARRYIGIVQPSIQPLSSTILDTASGLLDPDLEVIMALAKSDADAAEYKVREWYAQYDIRDPDQGGLDTHVANLLQVGLAKAFTAFLDSPETQAHLAKQRQEN